MPLQWLNPREIPGFIDSICLAKIVKVGDPPRRAAGPNVGLAGGKQGAPAPPGGGETTNQEGPHPPCERFLCGSGFGFGTPQEKNCAGFGNTASPGIAAQHVPGHAAQVQISRAFFRAAQIAEQVPLVSLQR